MNIEVVCCDDFRSSGQTVPLPMESLPESRYLTSRTAAGGGVSVESAFLTTPSVREKVGQ